MASDSSQSSSRSPSPSSLPSPSLSNNVGDTFIGSFISLISKFEIRYEGVLYHLNVQDSTLGLKNVRSCGTEGRKKDGSQVPPGDRVYDYILFRGSDIKDLQVIPSPSPQSRQEIRSEQDINQSSHSKPDMISPLSGYDSGYDLRRGTPDFSGKPVPATQQSSVPLSFQPPLANAGSSSSAQSNSGSSMPMPSFMQGNKVASTGVPLGLMQQEVSSSRMHNVPQIIDDFSSPIMGLVNETSRVVNRPTDIASNTSFSNHSPLDQAQLHNPHVLASSPSNLSPLSNARLSASNIQNNYSIAPQAVGKGLYDSSWSKNPNRSIPYELPARTLDSAPVITGPLLNSVYRGQEMFNPVSNNVQPQSLATRNYAPLLPLPVSAHQPRIPSSSIEFTEEFDFEAMNEKFKKSELWGFLGKQNQMNQNNYGEETAIEPNAEGKTKPAYNKDDFFDTISCNQLDRMPRSGQQQQQHPQFPEHMGQNPEVFGNHFQRPPPLQPGQGAYLAAQTNYRSGYGNNNNNNYPTGYGYYSGGRGRGYF